VIHSRHISAFPPPIQPSLRSCLAGPGAAAEVVVVVVVVLGGVVAGACGGIGDGGAGSTMRRMWSARWSPVIDTQVVRVVASLSVRHATPTPDNLIGRLAGSPRQGAVRAAGGSAPPSR
jgi:hypothetical protein